MSEQTCPKKRRTLIKFAVQKSVYEAGVGNTTEWDFITSTVGKDSNNGNEITTDCFYCEWLNSYGTVAIQQQADGTSQTARIRMTFVQSVYDALQNGTVKIYKQGITDAAHCFVLASSPDNYAESSKMLEFNVKHYEVK